MNIQSTLAHAEDTMNHLFREFAERVISIQQDTKAKIDTIVSSLPPTEVIGRMAVETTLAKVNAVKQDFEIRFEESSELLWARLGLASRDDIESLSRKIIELSKRVRALEDQLDTQTSKQVIAPPAPTTPAVEVKTELPKEPMSAQAQATQAAPTHKAGHKPQPNPHKKNRHH